MLLSLLFDFIFTHQKKRPCHFGKDVSCVINFCFNVFSNKENDRLMKLGGSESINTNPSIKNDGSLSVAYIILMAFVHNKALNVYRVFHYHQHLRETLLKRAVRPF